MISLLEVAERARSGPKMDEKDWNLGLFRRMQELAREYGLERLGREVFFDVDPGYADDAFQAAVDFIVSEGVFCFPLCRVLKFTEEEVRAALEETPREVTVGLGRDARTLRKREIQDTRPTNCIGGLHSPYSEDLGSLVPVNFAMIPRMDIIEGFNTTTTDGREIFGPPLEGYAARRELAWMREGVRKAGRPGMAISYYPINTRAATMIAPIDPDYGLRRTDGVLIKPLPDLKVEVDMLTAAIVYNEYGSYIFGGGASSIGGFCGGPEGAIIEAIAKVLVSILVYRGCMFNTGVGRLGFAEERVTMPPIWPTSMVHHALCRNSNAVRFAGLTYSGLGPGTELCLWERAADAVVTTILGSNFYITRKGRPEPNEGQTPLEVEFRIEVSDAMLKAGMKTDWAAEILQRISERLVGKPTLPGKKIQECYDLVRHRPSPEYEQTYQKVKADLVDMGLEFE